MRYIISFYLIVCSFVAFGQNNPLNTTLQVGVAGSQKLTNRMSLKMSLDLRGIPSPIENPDINLEDRRDFQVALERKIYGNIKIAAGGLYRFSVIENKQRLFQQVGLLQNTLSRLKLIHRFRIDETFSSEATEYRLRYRFGFETPSRGLRLDKRESYIVSYSEFLGKIQGGDYETELRLGAQFGYLFENSNKGEFRLEYRLGEPQEARKQLLILGFNYFFK